MDQEKIRAPWNVRPSGHVGDADDELVAIIYGAKGRPSGPCPARAKLIAAAPDMYEAIKLALDTGETDGGSEWDDGSITLMSSVVDELRAAVAKAEGKL